MNVAPSSPQMIPTPMNVFLLLAAAPIGIAIVYTILYYTCDAICSFYNDIRRPKAPRVRITESYDFGWKEKKPSPTFSDQPYTPRVPLPPRSLLPGRASYSNLPRRAGVPLTSPHPPTLIPGINGSTRKPFANLAQQYPFGHESMKECQVKGSAVLEKEKGAWL